MISLWRAPAPPACFAVATPWPGGIYAAAFALAPLLAWLWPLGFTVLVPVLSVMLLPLWTGPRAAWPFAGLAFALALWGAGTLGWSPVLPRVDPGNPETQFGLKLLLQVPVYGVFAAAAGALSGRAARRALTILAFGLLALGAVLVFEGGASAPVYRQVMAAMGEPIRPDLAERNVGKGQFVLVLLAWPALAVLAEDRRQLVPLLLGLLLLCPFLLNELAPVVGFLAGGVAYLAVRMGGALGARAVGVLLAVQLLASPWIVRAAVEGGLFAALARALPESWRQRLDIWSFVSERILERPLLGWGLEASRTFAPVPLHPHNAGLQVWLELGVVGAVLFALIWGRAFESVARVAARDRAAAAACAGAAGAYFTIGALSYGVWQEWWLATAAMVVAVCTALVVWRDHERLAWPPESRLHELDLRPL